MAPSQIGTTLKALLQSPLGVKKLYSYVRELGEAAGTPRKIVAGAIVVLWYHYGGYARFAKGKLVVFHPLWVYDMLSWVCSGLNTLINKSLIFQPRSPDWVADESLSPARVAASNKLDSTQIESLRQQLINKKDVKFREEHLAQLFDTLPVAKQGTMIGSTFKGRIVRSGCMLDVVEYLLVRPLQTLGFSWGKRYRTEHVGDALLLGWGNLVFTPLPVWGNVSMNRIGFRGCDTATMNYDHQPWKDYFRILNDGSNGKEVQILGLWTARDRTGGWFTLTHDPSTVTN